MNIKKSSRGGGGPKLRFIFTRFPSSSNWWNSCAQAPSAAPPKPSLFYFFLSSFFFLPVCCRRIYHHMYITRRDRISTHTCGAANGQKAWRWRVKNICSTRFTTVQLNALRAQQQQHCQTTKHSENKMLLQFTYPSLCTSRWGQLKRASSSDGSKRWSDCLSDPLYRPCWINRSLHFAKRLPVSWCWPGRMKTGNNVSNNRSVSCITFS